MVAIEAAPPLSAEHRAILAALLDPKADVDALDSLSLAAALKDPAVLEAIDAREFSCSLRLHQKLAAATSRAIEVLASILDSSHDPRELRIAANAILRLARRGSGFQPPRPGATILQPLGARQTRPSARSDVKPAEPASGPASANPSRALSAPFPSPSPVNGASGNGAPPPAHASHTPDQQSAIVSTVRTRLLSLRLARNQSSILRLLHPFLSTELRQDQHLRSRFLSSLVNSPAWTRRDDAITLSDPLISATGDSAILRATYGDAGHQASCTISLALPPGESTIAPASPTPGWLIRAISADTS